ncbi:MAG: lipid-A-disaccharide synthase [Deltaproteobacteria bacterium]|nr:lipid-A-disaccharide synthase [Deltaproteobacteria bacterium]
MRSFNGKITVICGEYSGEIHAANLINRLSKLIRLEYHAVGGNLLEKQGAKLIYDYRLISVTGLTEVLIKSIDIIKAYQKVKYHLEKDEPSLLILVDYPGFNLKIAKKAKERGIPVVYYIPPQVWAWGKRRIKYIKAYVDLVICFLPFEKKIYDFHSIRNKFVGHPYVKTVKPLYERNRFFEEFRVPHGCSIIAILPGSRENEVKRHMPELCKVMERIEGMVDNPFFLIAQAPGISTGQIGPYLRSTDNVRIVKGLSHDVLCHSDCAILASGSATLEAAILGTPSVVIYKLSPLSYLLGKYLVKIPNISLPNIILGEKIFAEFIQKLDPERIAVVVKDMLRDKKRNMKIVSAKLIDLLGGPSVDAYENAAIEVLYFLREIYGFVPEAA